MIKSKKNHGIISFGYKFDEVYNDEQKKQQTENNLNVPENVKPEIVSKKKNIYYGVYALQDTRIFLKPLKPITFLVLTSRFGKVYVYRFNKDKSLWMFSPTNPIRKFVIYTITNKIFELFVILTILVNCVFLALDKPPEEAEYVFTAIYTSEMVLKIIAKGFALHSFAYLRDPWNWLDFVVVLLGYATLAPGLVMNFHGIRTFRVLRALRTISAIEGLKTMVNALLKSMRMLSDVLVLTSFFLCIFALIGLQLFSGHFHNRCVSDQIINITRSNASFNEATRWSANWHESIQLCGNSSGAIKCPANYTCLSDVGPNPNYGFSSFDNFGWSLLTSFQLVTLDFWEDIYFHVGSTLGPIYVLYFMIVIFFGSFYLINLVLAVVAVSYQQETARHTDLEHQYEFLREVALMYSLHKRFLPKLLFDHPTIDDINHMSCVNSGPSVIILCSNTKNNEKNKNNTTVLSRVLEKKTDNDLHDDGAPHSMASRKLSKIIERVKLDRVKDKLHKKTLSIENQDNFINNNRNAGTIQSSKSETLNVPDVNSICKTLNNSTTETIASSPTISAKTNQQQLNGSLKPKKSLVRKVSSRLTADLEVVFKLPHENILTKDLRTSQKIQQNIYKIVMHPLFEIGVTLCILLNTIGLALEYDRMDKNFKKALNISNHVFTVIFTVEMILKLIAFTPFGYVKSKWNIFDGLVVLMSVIDLCIEIAGETNNGGFTILRSLRLFRVLKLAQSWSTMRLLLSAIARSLNALGNLTLILGIIVYIFAVVGMRLFGENYKAEKFSDKTVPEWNFTNFGHSFMVIFRVLCGEWIEPLYDCMLVTGTWPIAFFIPALAAGNFMVLNLFLALLLNSFADQAIEEELKRKTFMKSKLKWISSTRKVAQLQQAFKKQKITPGTNSEDKSPFSLKAIKSLKEVHALENDAKKTNEDNVTIKKLTSFCPSFASVICNNSSNSSHLRVKIKTIIENKWFDHGILILIVASSFVLVFEDIHLSSKPKLKTALDILNIIFCILFLMEFTLKVVALGVYTYFKNPWNCLDFLIVTVSVVSVINGFMNASSNLKTLRSLRTLRALRPLRAVSRWNGMRIVVNSLLKAIPSIGNVLLVCLVFWLIFSILGVQFFAGKFFKCVNQNGNRLDARVIPNKTMCIESGYIWKNSYVNFDNALNGFLPLLQVATFEGWIEVMKDAVDATQIDQQPVNENNFIAYLYFVIFIIVGAFFILNLFISVIIDNFYRMKKQYDDCGAIEVFLTHEQKQWFSTVRNALTKRPKRIIHRPTNFYQGKLFDIIISTKFESFTMMLIICNVILMMCQHYQQTKNYTSVITYANIVFTTIFSIELILRVIVLRHQYFLDKWNIFDFIIVILSIVGIILENLDVALSVTPSVLRVARVLRIGRLLRYFNSARGIRRLLISLVISLPALLNIGMLLLLILFIYSIIGMSNFGYVKKQGALNDVVNFETFGSSMLLLFRLITAAGWNEVLDSLMIQEPDCDPNDNDVANGNCSTPWIAVIYLVTFILITYLIIVNMYIAVILENFNQAHEQEEIGVTDEDIDMFYAVWQLYDPHATQFIEFQELPYFVANLGNPLGIPFPNKVAVHNLDLPMKQGDKIHCIDILQALLKRVVGDVAEVNTDHYESMKETIDKKLQAAFPMRVEEQLITTTMDRLKETKAASIIQRNFRSWKHRKKIREYNGSQRSVIFNRLETDKSLVSIKELQKKPLHRLSESKLGRFFRRSISNTPKRSRKHTQNELKDFQSQSAVFRQAASTPASIKGEDTAYTTRNHKDRHLTTPDSFQSFSSRSSSLNINSIDNVDNHTADMNSLNEFNENLDDNTTIPRHTKGCIKINVLDADDNTQSYDTNKNDLQSLGGKGKAMKSFAKELPHSCMPNVNTK